MPAGPASQSAAIPCHQQMAAAVGAVGAAEAGDRRLQARKTLDKLAFVAARRHPGSQDLTAGCELVDMPADRLPPLHVPGQTRPEPARSFRRTAVEINPRRQGSGGPPGNPHRDGSIDPDGEDVCSRHRRRCGRIRAKDQVGLGQQTTQEIPPTAVSGDSLSIGPDRFHDTGQTRVVDSAGLGPAAKRL
jgi:hypothetical protein